MTDEEKNRIIRWLANLTRSDFARQLGRFRMGDHEQYSRSDYEELRPIFEAELAKRTTRGNPCHSRRIRKNCEEPYGPGSWESEMGSRQHSCSNCEFFEVKERSPWARCHQFAAVSKAHDFKLAIGWLGHPDEPNTCSYFIELEAEDNPAMRNVHLRASEWAAILILRPRQIYQVYDKKGQQWDFERLSPTMYRVYTPEGQKIQVSKTMLFRHYAKNPLTDPEATSLLDIAREHVEDARHHKSATGASFDYGVASGIGEAIGLAGPAWARTKLGRGEHAVTRLPHRNPPHPFEYLSKRVAPYGTSTVAPKTLGEMAESAAHWGFGEAQKMRDLLFTLAPGRTASFPGSQPGHRLEVVKQYRRDRPEFAFRRERLDNPARISQRAALAAIAKAVEEGEELPKELVEYLDTGRYTFDGAPWREAIKEIRTRSIQGRKSRGLLRLPGHPIINCVGPDFEPNFRTAMEFRDFLVDTLIPDLKEGGVQFEGLTEEFTLISRYINHWAPIPESHKEYLKKLHKELVRQKMEATAHDIAEALYWYEKQHKRANPLTRKEAASTIKRANWVVRHTNKDYGQGYVASTQSTLWHHGPRAVLPMGVTQRHFDRHIRKNPMEGPVVIGEHCLAVEYQDVGKAKREGVANPKRPWRHDFKKTGAKVYGLPDGSVLIKGPHKLWRSQKNTVTGK